VEKIDSVTDFTSGSPEGRETPEPRNKATSLISVITVLGRSDPTIRDVCGIKTKSPQRICIEKAFVEACVQILLLTEDASWVFSLMAKNVVEW
jgi:hypothetical protein